MKNNKNERILNALGRADDRYVEEAMPKAARTDNVFEAEAVKAEPAAITAPKRKIYAGRVAAAACACVAAGGLVLWGAVGGMGSLTEDPASGGSGDLEEEYAQTGSPEENGYHNFTLTQEQLYNCAWSCFIPTYFPAGYQLSRDAQCVQANGLVDTNMDMEMILWLSSGIDDPDTEGYNPIYFSVRVMNENSSVIEIDPISDVYELKTLTVDDIAEMGKGGLIDCGHNVRLQITYPYPELISAEEVYKMIMSMPYTDQWKVYDSGYQIEYLTADEVYGTPFADYLPTALPAGYGITGLSPYICTQYSVNGNTSISLYISNGVEDPNLSNYCPIRYTVQSYGSGTDTSGKPVYIDICELTLQDVEAAMEYGGFFTTYSETDLIEVDFPYPDRVSAAAIYGMVKSAPCAADPNARPEAEHTLVYLSREELYTNMWTMYIPRELPKDYRLEDSVVYEVSDFANCGTIYIKLTDGRNPISYTVYAEPMLYDSLGAGAKLVTRHMDIGDIPLLKENGWIDFENATVKIKVDIADPDLISDEELYRFIVSAPAFDNFDAAGLDAGLLSNQMYTYLPEVNFDTFYDTERYTLSGEVFESSSAIIGFDGTYAYFNKWSQKDENGNALPEGEQLTQLGWYDVKTGETGLLPDSGYAGMLNYIYSDGEYVYCSKQKLTDEEEYKVVRYNVKSGSEEIILQLDNALLIGDVTVNGDLMFMYVHALNSSEYKLVRYDISSGVFGTVMKSASDLPSSAFSSIDVDMDSYAVTLPYKDGVIYIMPGSEAPDFIAASCRLFYWNGKNAAVPLFEARLDHIYDGEKGERLCFSDGEIVYFVCETYANGQDDTDGMQDTLCSFDLNDASAGFDSATEHILATNMNPTASPYHEWHGTAASCAGGMAAIGPYSGIIYDAENGWFTHVNTNVYYRAVKNNSSFDGMAMLEYADVEYDENVDFVDYPEGGKDLTLCIITRK